MLLPSACDALFMLLIQSISEWQGQSGNRAGGGGKLTSQTESYGTRGKGHGVHKT